MWLTSSKEEAFEHLPFTAKAIALEVESLGGAWGCWIYNDDFEVAKWSNGEEGVAYFDLAISADMYIPKIVKAVSEIRQYSINCGHSFDCCGCVFFKRLSASSCSASNPCWYTTPSERLYTFTFKEEWGRNV